MVHPRIQRIIASVAKLLNILTSLSAMGLSAYVYLHTQGMFVDEQQISTKTNTQVMDVLAAIEEESKDRHEQNLIVNDQMDTMRQTLENTVSEARQGRLTHAVQTGHYASVTGVEHPMTLPGTGLHDVRFELSSHVDRYVRGEIESEAADGRDGDRVCLVQGCSKSDIEDYYKPGTPARTKQELGEKCVCHRRVSQRFTLEHDAETRTVGFLIGAAGSSCPSEMEISYKTYVYQSTGERTLVDHRVLRYLKPKSMKRCTPDVEYVLDDGIWDESVAKKKSGRRIVAPKM
jgi:protein required for attachment to host cells